MTAVITADKLDFSYGDKSVLQNVSFKVQPGEFIGIIGPNGGGKTTLLKLILGFLKPTSGSLLVLDAPPKERQSSMAYVPQSLQFDRHFPISTFELVLAGRLSQLPWYGVYAQSDIDAADKALAEVGLSAFRNQAFGNLSGGQKQRALIARALASNPQLLLLDEPTASVDNDAEAEILKLLRSLKGKMTILMVTHDLQTAIDHVDRLFVVQRDLLAYSPEEVCEHYAMGLYHPPLISLRSKGIP